MITSADSAMFPLDEIDPRLKGNEWITAYGKAINWKYSNNRFYTSPSDTTRLTRIRNYSNGLQDMDKYIDMFLSAGDEKTTGNPDARTSPQNARIKRKGYVNLSWEIVSVAQTLKRIIMNLVGTERQYCDIEALSKENKNKKLMMKAKTYYKAKLAPIMREIGKPIKEEAFMPPNRVALEMYDMIGGFNLNFEISAKKLIEHGLQISSYVQTESQFKEDAIDFNFITGKVCVDPVTGIVKFKYIDPIRFIAPWTDQTQGDNAPFAGAYCMYSIPQLRDLLTPHYPPEKVEEMLVQAASSAYQGRKAAGGSNQYDWGWYQKKDTITNRFRYDEFFIDVLEFEVISKDINRYSKRDSKHNPNYKDVRKQSFDYASQSGNKEVFDISTHVIYEGWYVPTLDVAVGGKQKNMMRLDKRTPLLSFQMVKIAGKSIGESLIPIYDMLQVIHIKLQAAILAAKPKGIAVELSALSQLNIGGQLYAPQDIVKVYSQTGTMIYKAVVQGGKVISSMPITELEGGIGKQLAEWIGAWNHHIQLAFQISGITPIMGASPDTSGEKLVGVANAEREATINNLGIIQSALEEMHVKASKAVLLKTLAVCAAKGASKSYYEGVIGQDKIDELMLSTGLTLDEMGIYITRRVSENEKMMVMRAIEKAQGAGRDGVSLLDPSDELMALKMLEKGQPDEAARYIQYIVTEKRRIQDENIAANSQQQAQQLQQLEMVKTQMALQFEQGKSQIEVQKHMAMSQIDVVKEKAIISAESTANIAELEMEAIFQKQYGVDTGPKIAVTN
jgi:hypothetical protein